MPRRASSHKLVIGAMSTDPFHFPTDPPCWDKTRRRIDLVFGDQPDIAERHETLDWYRDLLGADWPGFTNRHPLAGWLEVDGPTEYRRMAETVLDLPHAREIAKGLGGPHKSDFDSALQTLYFASGLRRAGKLVELLGMGRGEVIPDLRTHLRHRWVTCELTVMQPSDLLTNGWQFWTWLHTLSMPRGRGRTGHVHITFDPSLNTTHLLQKRDEIEQHVLRIADTMAPGSINIHGLGLFEYDPNFGGELFVDAANVIDEVIESVGTSNDMRRVLARTVTKAAKQLRGQGATVFVVRAPFLGFGLRDTAILDDSLVAAAREALAKAPCVSAILIYDRNGLRGDAVEASHAAEGNDRAVVASDASERQRWAVIINNPLAEVPLTNEECDDLVGPKMCW